MKYFIVKLIYCVYLVATVFVKNIFNILSFQYHKHLLIGCSHFIFSYLDHKVEECC